MKERRLISTRREVAAESRAEYRVAWGELRAAAEEAGAHAWRFVSAADATRYLEFLEFAPGRDPRDLPRVAAALAALERLAPGAAEEWLESRN